MADDSEQDRRACHLIVRGIKKSDEPKITITNILAEKTNSTLTQDDLKFVIKLTTTDAAPDTETYKIGFHERRKRDEIFARRTKLKGTDTYISEDLTIRRSKLAYEARRRTKEIAGSSTWTHDGKIYFKDSHNSKPRAITCVIDLTTELSDHSAQEKK